MAVLRGDTQLPVFFLLPIPRRWIRNFSSAKIRLHSRRMSVEDEIHAAFPPTHWTLIAAAGGADNEAALSRLYRIYWKPLRTQTLRFGVREDDADDVLQELFIALFTSGSLFRADAERGRFRSYLLGALRNFLSHRRARLSAEKRGGGQNSLPIEDGDVAAPTDGTPMDERAFDAEWARALVHAALHRFEVEQKATHEGRSSYAALGALALGDSREPIEAAAARLGLTVPGVKSRLFRMRERFREIVREEVFRTVPTASECDDELRYLHAVLGNVNGLPVVSAV